MKLQWTREDDLAGGRYRPMFLHKFDAGLDAAGNLTAWRNVVVGQSIMAGTPMGKGPIDATSVEGSATIDYEIPNIAVDLATATNGVPVLWWRVVGSSHTSFAVESFMDEVAHAAGKDPFEFRRAMLGKSPRMKARFGTGRREGRLEFNAAAEGTRSRHRGRRGFQDPGRPGGRGHRQRARRNQGRPGRLCGRLRRGDQPGHHRGADGGRHRLRPRGRALRRHHA